MPFVQFQIRRGTAAEWTSADPTLAAGELGLETDTQQIKVGDGSTAWSSLLYMPVVGGVANSIQINSGNQLAGSANLTYDGANISIGGNIVPTANVTYDLGTTDLRWNSLYLAGNTIDLGGGTIKTDAAAGLLLTPPATDGNPNPTAILINPAGKFVPIPTAGGVPNANAVANAAGTADSEFANVIVTGNLTANTGVITVGNVVIEGDRITSANSIITIDPAADGNTGTVIIEGNLTVRGTTTTIDSETIVVDDLQINMANSAATAANANGGGIGVGPLGSEYATLLYDADQSAWVTNIDVQTAANITAGYFIGNGSQLTGLPEQYGNADVANYLPTFTGNIGAGNVTATGNITANFFSGNGSQLTGVQAFSNITVANGNSLVANGTSSTLTMVAGDGITLVANTDASTLTVIAADTPDDIWYNGHDFGFTTQMISQEEDLGGITDSVLERIRLGRIAKDGVFAPQTFFLPTYSLANLPSPALAGQMIYVNDESGGSVPAFSDGTYWRRCTDRQPVS